jgi:hypothetical protein
MAITNNQFSEKTKQAKLKRLMEIEDMSIEDVEMSAFHSRVYGICKQYSCDYTTEVEPDQDEGWCPFCETRSVESAASLNGSI